MRHEFLSYCAFIALCLSAATTNAQQPAPAEQQKQQTQTPQPQPQEDLTEDQLRKRYEQSMSYMLRRADMTRALAAEHLMYMDENAALPEVHLIEEASQVLAFDVVCADDVIEASGLQHIATATTYKIAVLAGRSPIVNKLSEIGQQQPIRDRMNLLGDISTIVFMHKIGRRRGLFDSLVTDFGQEKFCNGMRANMRDRYNSLTSDIPNPADGLSK